MSKFNHVAVQKENMKKEKAKTSTQMTNLPVVDSKELAVFETQVVEASTYANNLVVSTQEQYDSALEEGKRIKSFLDSVKKRKEEITKPMYASYKSVLSLFGAIEDPAEKSLSLIKRKMTDHYRLEQEKAVTAVERLADRVIKGTMKQETAIRKMDEIQTPIQTIKTESATGTMRKVQKWRVVDKSLIPLIFMDPNMVAIKQAFKSGQPVPGVEQYEESELSIS